MRTGCDYCGYHCNNLYAALYLVPVSKISVLRTSAVLALLHDVLVVLAFYAIARISVGNTFIACMLTIVGYSINATIVIFDRIREELTAHEEKDRSESACKQKYHTDTDKKYLYITDNICHGGGTVILWV